MSAALRPLCTTGLGELVLDLTWVELWKHRSKTRIVSCRVAWLLQATILSPQRQKATCIGGGPRAKGLVCVGVIPIARRSLGSARRSRELEARGAPARRAAQRWLLWA